MPEELPEDLELDELEEDEQPSAESEGKAKRETVAERIKRVKRREREKLEAEVAQRLATAGIKDWDELSAIAQEREAAAVANMTELERLQKELAKRDAILAEKEQALASVQSQIRTDKRKSAIVSAASGCKYPEQVWLWLQAYKPTELESAQDADGNMNADTVKALVGEASKAMPDLFRVSDVPTPALPPRSTSAASPKDLSPSQLRREARKSGY